ncbi:MAG: hypothetical protein AB7G62_10845 [Magnetospirillum sp.]
MRGRVLLTITIAAALSLLLLFGQKWAQAPFNASHEMKAVLTGVVALIFAALLGRRFSKLGEAAASGGISLVLCVVMLLLAEATFFFFPGLIPEVLTSQAPALRKKSDLLEYPAHSPWVKFRPNILVETADIRGEDFVTKWQTDQRGFKNLPEVAARNDFVALAAGDSFVEAMGVATEKTWTSQVSLAGFPVYNLGVQGYAPIQALGAVTHYTTDLKAKVILLGYTPGFEGRELNYINQDQSLPKSFTGGIGDIHTMVEDSRKAGHYKYFPVINSTIDILRHSMGSVIVNAQFFVHDMLHARATIEGPLAPYQEQTLQSADTVFSPEAPESILMQRRLEELKSLAAARGATPALVYFPNRSEVYWPRIAGTPMSADHPSARRRAWIKQVCVSLGIDVIDTSPLFAMTMLQEPLTSLPFNRIDGHYSPHGNALVAKAVTAYLAHR